jgi:hypothetical protein
MPRSTVGLTLLGVGFFAAHAVTAQIVVPDDHATIQAAIDAASPGETVTVRAGTYTENITLPSDITVLGEEAARTFLRPAGTTPTVTIAGESDVVLARFTLLDARVGIFVENATDVLIANTIIDGAATAALDADAISSFDAENNVFRRNAIAIRGGSADTNVTNNIFVENTETVRNVGLANPPFTIEYNCFFRNADLLQGGVDRGLGTNATIGDPLFASAVNRDFHLREGSPCIDAGTGTDGIDATVADMGAYGGALADALPFPVPQPSVVDASANPPPPHSIRLTWEQNVAYLVSSSANPGGYRVHYSLNAPGPPYAGTDAGAGSLP